MLNNAFIIRQLARQLDAEPDPSSTMSAPMRERLHSEPVMVPGLPTTGQYSLAGYLAAFVDPLKAFIEREAEHLAPMAVIRQLRRSPSPSPPSSVEGDATPHPSPSPEPSDPKEEEESEQPRRRTRSISSVFSSISLPSPRLSLRRLSGLPQAGSERKIEPYEVFAAVERKDITFLMEVRDRAFHLLVHRHGGDTPLLHAMRCGPGHQDVAIVILGAFSRFINHLSDEDFVRPGTKILLRALRVNLRAAIDMGLHTRQVDLVASFLQTLVMSEGERWVSMQAASVAAAMRRETEDKPVKTAENAVRGFATKELGKANTIMTCEDYIANATGDLLMMGAWHAAVEAGVEGELIPTWYFARDDRVYRAFAERLKEHKKELEQRCSKRLKWQLRLLDFAMAQRASTWHQKVGMVEQELDHGEGVN
ncbi:uncharacterized protein C8Q71DRAFT_14120 [Rhodofomes roseus]|uniref:Uncharacterized protein n=1 Tax=Rhodofomes roseus TaxID=34475 RepID=A0ABQ8KXL2_9APHY|nr:uncharacterized protein C8Q71DRAFT_14120 [Rhodofomes roseus]KAH9843804.1 hypothetical protein C8Q71DRAFT_14120 [Rhodofomes roseus]